MPYYTTGSLTFTTQANRDTALTATTAVNLGTAVPWAGKYPAGIVASGTTGLTISLVMDVTTDAPARTVTRALFNAYSPYVRNAGHLALVKVVP